MTQPIKFYFDMLSQQSRALYIFFEATKIPFEPIPISTLKGEHLTGEYRDKVNRFKTVPAINDHGFQLVEPMSIFRHLNREKIVPEHWYPRRNLSRSRIDEFTEWQNNHLQSACTDYFRAKWMQPALTKSRPSEEAINQSIKRLDRALNDFEDLWLKKTEGFLIGSDVTIADLFAICEVDQPKAIGYSPFKNRKNLKNWYEMVREALGPYYTEVNQDFQNQVKFVDSNKKISLEQ